MVSRPGWDVMVDVGAFSACVRSYFVRRVGEMRVL